jgi:cell division protein FtsI/penicillin-binding protein 2
VEEKDPQEEKGKEEETKLNARRLSLVLMVTSLAAGIPARAAGIRLDGAARICLSKHLAARTSELQIGRRDAFAVMDPHTGRVLWHRHPKVLAQAAYQPGSILKVVTAYVALSGSKVYAGEIYSCRGGDILEGPETAPVRCWLRAGHGPVNLAKALALSCNLYFANLGTRVGAGPLLQGARQFGLGRSTGSDLPGEIPGSLPKAPVTGQAARLAVGQGSEVEVTPLQILSLVGAIANDGILLSPRFSDPGGGQSAVRGTLTDGAALRFVRNAMEEASTFGTGSAQRLRKLRLAGKTGTSAWRVGWKTHAWYMGFAPMRTPVVAIVVFVYEGQGSKEGAAVARKVMETVYQEMKACGILAAK